MKVYGPYYRKDGRKHVVIIDGDERRTVSYPKFLLEKKIGRSLNDNETCDHKDGNHTNDNEDNLQVLSRADNARKNFLDNPSRKRKHTTFVCPVCNTEATKPTNYVNNNIKQGKSGPYCSRSCAGKRRS